MKKIIISLKGGTGSGFHGHKGRPGKVGGSQSTAISSNKTLYHFTSKTNIESIKKKGFLPSKHALLGNAIYLTDDPSWENVGSRYNTNARIEVRVNVKNTRVFEKGYAGYAKWIVEAAKGDINADPIKLLREEGYDSALLKKASGNIFMIFDPNDINVINAEEYKS